MRAREYGVNGFCRNSTCAHRMPCRTTASSVWQVFDGRGTVTLDGEVHQLEHGDVFAVPSWCELALYADTELDLFTFSDAPVFEKLSLLRTEITG